MTRSDDKQADERLYEAVVATHQLLSAGNNTLVLAESCTAGLIAASLARSPGFLRFSLVVWWSIRFPAKSGGLESARTAFIARVSSARLWHGKWLQVLCGRRHMPQYRLPSPDTSGQMPQHISTALRGLRLHTEWLRDLWPDCS